MKTVLLLLPEGYETYEASAFIDVFGWNLIDGDGSTKLMTCGLVPIVKTSFGQRSLVDCLVDDVDVEAFDALAIPGGFEEYGFLAGAQDARVRKLIQEFCGRNKPIASICVGALCVAYSGILVGKRATTYLGDSGRWARELERCGAQVVDKPVVCDGQIITSWNPATAIEVALLLLEKLTSAENASLIRRLMGFVGN